MWIVLAGVVLCASAAASRADCIDDAARFHHVNTRLVRAIVTVESGQHPNVVHLNPDGTTDIGLMQINSRWLATLAHFGISRAALYDGCTNAYVGAWILSQDIRRDGLTWDAVGAYNAGTHEKRVAYARRIYARMIAAPAAEAAGARPVPWPSPLPSQHPGFIARLFMPVTAWEAGR
ncbi:lytic transglycosylase domain-containing protein [Paraburkholderia sp. SIMBA_030]|uniref:lytic transglycosylase domain-containing protein n=1 Tax=Paraburkholderia sp. SIMBA_030 TaxID=3085773 RepID=UPI00397C6B82